MITVLMSTYNGEKYIKQQIDSIYAQNNVKIQLIVRDDGSTDQTTEILRSYEAQNLKWYKGTNCGAACSFMKMIYESPESEYYALADQDDIWLPEKLESAINMIKHECGKDDIPLLYFCNQIFLYGDEQIGEYRHPATYSIPTLVQTILGNDISGCTMVFNNKLKKCLCSHKIEEAVLRMRYHDVWIVALASIYGRILFDSRPYMLFRRHERNETNGKTAEEIRNSRGFSDYIRILKGKHNQESKNWAYEILRCCEEDLDCEDRKLVKKIAFYDRNIKSKISLLLDTHIIKYWKGKRRYFYAKVFLGWM